MKFIFILIFKEDVKNVTDFFDRKEMQMHEAKNLNDNLKNLVWILQPNY